MTARLVIPAHLHLICSHCLVEAGFEGKTPEAALALARAYGWIVTADRVTGPRCPAYRPKLSAAQQDEATHTMVRVASTEALA